MLLVNMIKTLVIGAFAYVICGTMKQKQIGWLTGTFAVLVALGFFLEGLDNIINAIRNFFNSLIPWRN